MISFDELKKMIKEEGYFAEDELLFDAYNALCMFGNKKPKTGQDIFAICLEGPPGAGKTEFAKVYTTVCKKIFHNNVELVDYQCDATTGKTELFEDINISAAIRRDADHVNIPGKLVEAIKKVNQGSKVVLFIDEYDKAREETDAFLLQFLQSGKINSTQHGDLEVYDSRKGDLQVILCKNDMREELSGPLSRRIRIARLDYMKPDVFYKVAHRVLIDLKSDAEKVDNGLLNLVVLMYEQAYAAREVYNRLPSCSEMLIAIEDADRLLKRANAPQNIIYNCIIRNMFKSIDDIKTFERGLEKAKKSGNSKLANLVEEMKKGDTNNNAPESLNSLISRTVFDDQNKELSSKIAEMEKMIEEYRIKFIEMEEKRKKEIDDELLRISLENGKLVSYSGTPKVVRNFEDEAEYIKRGFNIFDITNRDWVDVGEVQIPSLSHHHFIDKLHEYAGSVDIKMYENGILLKEDGEQKLIVICDLDENGVQRYRFMANHPVIPSTYLADIKNFISFMTDSYSSQPKNAKEITNQVVGIPNGVFSLNTLVYSDSDLDFDSECPSVYNVNISSAIDNLNILEDTISKSSCADVEKAVEKSNSIMGGKAKVKEYE